MIGSFQKKIEITVKQEIDKSTEKQKDYFDIEKTEFLKAIQENMTILEMMLKDYSQKCENLN